MTSIEAAPGPPVRCAMRRRASVPSAGGPERDPSRSVRDAPWRSSTARSGLGKAAIPSSFGESRHAVTARTGSPAPPAMRPRPPPWSQAVACGARAPFSPCARRPGWPEQNAGTTGAFDCPDAAMEPCPTELVGCLGVLPACVDCDRADAHVGDCNGCTSEVAKISATASMRASDHDLGYAIIVLRRKRSAHLYQGWRAPLRQTTLQWSGLRSKVRMAPSFSPIRRSDAKV